MRLKFHKRRIRIIQKNQRKGRKRSRFLLHLKRGGLKRCNIRERIMNLTKEKKNMRILICQNRRQHNAKNKNTPIVMKRNKAVQKGPKIIFMKTLIYLWFGMKLEHLASMERLSLNSTTMTTLR
jgi:hypothetical protein